MSPTSYDHYHAASHWPPDETFLLLPQQSWMQPSSHGGSPYHSMPTSGFGFHQPYAAQVADAYERPIRKKRASKPKVRTGCTTCKIRRVKCDEGKPSCVRCTSTGRKCDGYEFVRKDSSDVVVATTLTPPHQEKLNVPDLYVLKNATSLAKVFDGTVQERRAFHRFKHRTVPAFAGGSEADFWTQLVLQAAAAEPVIREAVVALGTLHEEYETRRGRYDQGVVEGASHQDATRLYGSAIRHLYQRIDRSPGETERLAVIASILFTCFEVLRRNDMAAVVHYQAGMRALIKQMNQRDRALEFAPASAEDLETTELRQRPQDDLDRMLRVFARYDIQACTFSKPRAEPLHVDTLPPPPVNVGLMEMRHYLDNILIAVYQLVKSDLGMFRYWKAEEVSPSWHEKRADALQTFQGWLDVLEKSAPSDAVALRQHGITASKSILGLILQVRIAMLMLRTCIDNGPEMTFDQFTGQYEDMITRVERMTESLKMVDAGPLGHESVPFTMELGVIHPLFYIAWKCRDWSLRRRAVAELRKCGKEGVWEGPIMAVVAERIIQIEEQGLQPGDFVPESARIHAITKGVEYDRRVVRAELKVAQDTTWKNWTILRETIAF